LSAARSLGARRNIRQQSGSRQIGSGPDRLRSRGRLGTPDRAAEDRAGRGRFPLRLELKPGPEKNNSWRLRRIPEAARRSNRRTPGGPASVWKFSRNLSCVAAPAGGADPGAVTRVTWITPVTGVARDDGAAENCQVRAARGAGHQESSAFPAETRPDRCQTDTCAFWSHRRRRARQEAASAGTVQGRPSTRRGAPMGKHRLMAPASLAGQAAAVRAGQAAAVRGERRRAR
jgi:hypothetical protein